jgi:mannose-1-phosphate guanylyltransferase / mannose-6-phosphate isomerase
MKAPRDVPPGMSNHKIVPLILAGGNGTRLWPLSRETMPKQFLPLIGERTFYQDALLRVHSGLFCQPIVIVNEAFRFFAERQARDVDASPTILLEPVARDSGPAIAAGAKLAMREDPDAIVMAMAADHVILEPDLFRDTCAVALEGALSGYIVTFGIPPTSPQAGYGYIRPGPSLNGNGLAAVESFIEKPTAEAAAKLIMEGLLWNSGNFLFRADLMISELERFEPDIHRAALEAVAQSRLDSGFIRLHPESFARQPSKSIDYAVMERTDHAAVIKAPYRWSDVGSWDSLAALSRADDEGNVTIGDVELLSTTESLVYSQRGLTAVIGLDRCVVVSADDAVLVASKEDLHKLKPLVQRLRQKGRAEAREHPRVYRPWGFYQVIDKGPRFCVKRIVVDPGEKLSLQKHIHRAEHWVVVRGTAGVVRGEEERLLTENQSIYVPLGENHRLFNPGRIPLELIEVQTGSYLGEDDIIRLQDVYSRA